MVQSSSGWELEVATFSIDVGVECSSLKAFSIDSGGGVKHSSLTEVLLEQPSSEWEVPVATFSVNTGVGVKHSSLIEVVESLLLESSNELEAEEHDPRLVEEMGSQDERGKRPADFAVNRNKKPITNKLL